MQHYSPQAQAHGPKNTDISLTWMPHCLRHMHPAPQRGKCLHAYPRPPPWPTSIPAIAARMRSLSGGSVNGLPLPDEATAGEAALEAAACPPTSKHRESSVRIADGWVNNTVGADYEN